MTYEEKKKYLSCFSTLDAHIDALIKEKEKWYNRALSIKYTDFDVDNVGNLLKKASELEKEIDKNIDALVDIREKITNDIGSIDDFVCKEILYLKYISGNSFEQIGEKLGYSEKQIGRLHKKAIEKIIL